jgi:Xaa-Pro aminopeptidase
MGTEEFKKACYNLEKDEFDFAIISSHENVVYVSGFDTPLSIGAIADISNSLPLAVVILNVREKIGHLIVADAYAKQAEIQNRLEYSSTFSVFNHFSSTDPSSNLINVVKNVLQGFGLNDNSYSKIGIEFETVPATLFNLLNSKFSNARVFSAKPTLDRSRWIKTDSEIKRLRDAASIVDAGQKFLVDFASNFERISEFELWCKVKAEILKKANKKVPVPMVGELVSGSRTSTVAPGGPVPHIINKGDTGIMDISIRIDGYWADCTNVVIFGDEPVKEQKKYFKTAKDGFEAAFESLKPGTSCCEVENSVRKAFKKNGFSVVHYSGHQIGATVNELPRIVEYDKSLVQAGMVFCLEPGIYSGPGGNTGARLEKMVLVTESGPEILNDFPWGIE